MSFAIFQDPKVQELVETFGAQRSLVVVIGAGASVEARLPTWEQFIERLLRAAAESTDAFDLTNEQVDSWVSRTLSSESLLGAAGIADALSDGDLEALIPTALFGDKSISEYQPGPTLIQLAHLREVFADHVSFITTNYDDLFEEALRKQQLLPEPYVKSGTPIKEGRVPVFHPHGFIARPRKKGGKMRMHAPFIVSEEHFQGVDPQFAEHQRAAVASKLLEHPCLFVGVSLTDPNLLRYIYRYTTGEHPHAAIFIRQAEYGVEPDASGLHRPRQVGKAVQAAREEAICARWTKRNLNAVFLDHFSDLAYLIHEIAFIKKTRPTVKKTIPAYERLDIRTAKWLRSFQRTYAPKNSDDFKEAQVALNTILREALASAIKSVEKTMADRGEPVGLGDENIAAALWVTSPTGKTLNNWATTDRLHLDPRTVTARQLDVGSRWFAVKTVLHGLSYAGSRELYESRWRYLVGLPLHIQIDEYGTLPVGCITVTSTKAAQNTLLRQLPGTVSAGFKRILVKAVEESLRTTVPA